MRREVADALRKAAGAAVSYLRILGMLLVDYEEPASAELRGLTRSATKFWLIARS